MARRTQIPALKNYNEESGCCGPLNDHSMERVEFTLDGPSLIVPARGCILLVRFRLAGQQEIDRIFCDYGMRSGRSLQLFDCRIKVPLFESTTPCDHALKVGTMTVPAEQVVEVFQLITPPWYYRLEEDAWALARQSRDVAEEIGLSDLFQAMTGSK
ncbi:MAG: hypothetical protein ABS95_01225 [Verrucomicrobia bacterium SCN 57-15]|nr:MAG: hypothetical protein ABS95_01225 [Verrucomicrobia bacterium SCN 57-15]